MAFHSVHLIGSRSVLGQRCNADATISACTRFFARKLDCACEGAEQQWRIAAKARFHAVTFLATPAALQHEHRHIADIRRDIASHINEIGAIRFESAEACQAAATAASAAFADVMDAFQWTSNAERHVMQRPFRPRPKLLEPAAKTASAAEAP